VVAAIHGVALGGGLEIGMGAHYRVAHVKAKLGMPEVKLGLIPGATGTQRLPRLVGVDEALTMITSGKPVSAENALASGLVDKIIDGPDIRIAGVSFAREILNGNFRDEFVDEALVRRTGERAAPVCTDEHLTVWREKLTRSSRGEVAAIRAVDAVANSRTLDLEAGIKAERQLFKDLMETPQRAGLIHAFFSERKVSNLPELADVETLGVAEIGVVGGGTMGAGIATAALLKNYSVTLIEQDLTSAKKAASSIKLNLDGAVKRGKISQAQHSELLNEKLQTDTRYNALSKADLIIEAVFESMDIKKVVFEALDAVAKPEAILATNTSYLDVNEIAAVTQRPESVIGLHFFSPAHVMKLLEVVVAEKTKPSVVATAFSLAKSLGKISVKSGVCDGFIGNRILSHYRAAADHMVLDGASPYQIDRALTDYGFAMGPYAVSDMAGLDIGYAARQRRRPVAHPRERYPIFADELYQQGRLGQKTGKGYYVYPAATRKRLEDPEVEAIVDQARIEAGIVPRSFTTEEIVRRILAAIVNESARILEEGIATRPLDIDIVFLSGYGFPRWRGGPLYAADSAGLSTILSDIKLFAEADDFFWQTAPLLSRLVEEGQDFNSLNSD